MLDILLLSNRKIKGEKIMIKNAIKHFKKICIHKYWVFHYCRMAGITWQGIKHDMSKFSPIEFWESVKYYQGDRSPIDACKEENGWSVAWLHHKGRNPHHYEYWQDNFDKGGEAICPPMKYMKEMFCDFMAAGRAYHGKNFTISNEIKWWENKKKTAAMHPDNIEFIDVCLAIVSYYGEKRGFSIIKRIYESKN